MKKNTLIFLIAAAVMTVSCNQGPERANTKITEYLYGVEYDDYDFSRGVKLFERYVPEAAGCSEVRKGDFVGRNLDWYINNDASAVVKVNNNGERYASLGVMGCATVFDTEFAANGEYADIYGILPMFTVDGVNENGVYCGVNVMPTGETSLDSTKWETGAWGRGAAFTNPESDKTYCVTYLVRVILDNAESVEDARQIVEGINWFEPCGFPKEGSSQAFHWLVCDSQTSMVLEFVDNKPCFIETENVSEPSMATIMTNFTNTVKEQAGLIQTTGCGYERWDILAAAYPGAEESFQGIQNLMKNVWYSQFYTKDAGDDNFFMTDFSTPQRPSAFLYGNREFQRTQEWAELVAKSKAEFENPDNWHSAGSPLWYTTHTSVYQLSEKKLHLFLHEGYDNQDKTHIFLLEESRFVKPLEFGRVVIQK